MKRFKTVKGHCITWTIHEDTETITIEVVTNEN